ncbi:fimbrial chaperone [Escherichia coli]|nr:fimbrial chaperone [Escherichia coli]
MTRTRQLLLASLFTCAGALASFSACADIVLSGTRIIYNANQKEVSLRMENKGSRPLLVQTWIDTGSENADPSTITVPFTVTPPVSRVDGKRGQTVKIAWNTSQTLPADRESVFWFNALEVPQNERDRGSGKNILQLAFRTRIKLFYRPANLVGSAPDAPKQLTWHLQSSGGKVVLQATNPTPFHVSFSSISLISGGKKIRRRRHDGLPKSSADMTVKGLSTASAGATIEYTAINDFGGAIEGKVKL